MDIFDAMIDAPDASTDVENYFGKKIVLRMRCRELKQQGELAQLASIVDMLNFAEDSPELINQVYIDEVFGQCRNCFDNCPVALHFARKMQVQ